MKILGLIDADTYKVEIDGKVTSIRINNVDAHESTENNNPTALGAFAKGYVQAANPKVDTSGGTDHYGRNLGTMTEADGSDLGDRLIRQGLGVPMTPDGEESFRLFRKYGAEAESDPIRQAIIDMAGVAREGGVEYENAGMPDFERNDRRGVGARAFDRGGEGLKANAYAFLQALNGVVGDDEDAKEYQRKAAYHAEQAGLIPKEFDSYKQVDSLGDAAVYAYELLAEEAPSLVMDAALTATGAGAGAVIARRGATMALRNKLGQEGFDQLATKHPQLLANLQNSAGVRGAKTGAKAAYVGSVYPQEVGSIQQELNSEGLEDENLTALGMGAVSAVVQAAPEIALAGRLLKQADVDASDLAGITATAKTMAKNIGVTAIAEGAAEGAATVLQKSAVALHKDDYEIFSEQNIAEMKEAIVAGTVVGGTLATAGSAGAAGYRKADEIYREKREARLAEQQAALAAEQQAQAQQATQQDRGFTIDTTPESESAEAAKYQPTFEYGNTAAPAQDKPDNANFNPKLDSDLSVPAAVATTEPAPAEGASQAIPTPTQQQTEVTQKQQADTSTEGEEFTPTEEQIAQARQHPAFVAVTKALQQGGLKDGRIPADMLSPEDRDTLTNLDSIIVDPVDGQSLIVDPQLVDDVIRYSPESTEAEQPASGVEAPNFPQGIEYFGPAPTLSAARSESLGKSAQYGEGNPDPDGVYDRGTGRSIFKELAQMAADEKQMRKSERTGQTRATSEFVEMIDSIDPLSDEFDDQLEKLAQYVRTWGNGKADEVNQMLDRARLRTPDVEQTVPVLREAHAKLSQMDGVQLKGDNLNKFRAAVKYVNQLSDSLVKTVPGFQKAERFTDQMIDIIDALNSGVVKLNAKQQSVVHAIASNSFVSASKLWKDRTGTTETVYSEQSFDVRWAQAAIHRDEALDAPEFVVTMPRDSVDRNDISRKVNRLKQWLSSARQTLESELEKVNADFPRIKRLTTAISQASEWLYHAAKYRPDNARRQKALTNLVNEFQSLGDAANPLRDALRRHHEGTGQLQAQQRYENEDGTEAPEATMRATGPDGSEETDLVDVAGAVGDSADDFDIAISAEAEEFLNRYHRLRLGLSKDTVNMIPLRLRIQSFARTFTDVASRAPNDFKAPETANERRVRLSSQLQTTISIVQAFKSNIMSEVKDNMMAGFLAQNPDLTSDDLVKDSSYLEVETNIERQLFEATLNRVTGENNPEFQEVFDITSARRAIRDLRSEIQNTRRDNAAPSSTLIIDPSDGQTILGVKKPRWYNDNVRSIGTKEELDTLNSKLSAALESAALEMQEVLKDLSRDDLADYEKALRDAEIRIVRKAMAGIRNDRDTAERLAKFGVPTDSLLALEQLAGILGANDSPVTKINSGSNQSTAVSNSRSEVFQALAFIENGRSLPRKMEQSDDAMAWERPELTEEESENLTIEEAMRLQSQKLRHLDAKREASETAQGEAPLDGKTSREMYDVSTTLLQSINTAVRAVIDARWESKSHPEIREAIRNGDYAALINYAADNDIIPAAGNSLEQLIKNTTEMAASNRTMNLVRYFRTSPAKGSAPSEVKLEMEYADGNNTFVYMDVAEFIRDHIARVSPDMVDPQHGARKGSTALEDGVLDDSDPLSDRAAFDRISHIKNAFDILLSDLMGMDPDILGFSITSGSVRDLLLDGAELTLYKDDGDSVTLKHLRDTLATRIVQARIADNHEATHDISETKRQKASAAMQLEKGMVQLLDIVSPESGDKTVLTRLATLLSKANRTRMSAAHIARATVNIPRQLGALSRLVYGKNGTHLDDANDLDSGTQAYNIAFDADGRRLPIEKIDESRALKARSDSDFLFTESTLPPTRFKVLEQIAADSRNSAHLSKVGAQHDDILNKYALQDGEKDYTKTTELVDIEYLAKLFDVMKSNADSLGIADPLDGTAMTEAYNALILAREKLALSFNVRDYSSIADDKSMPDELDNSVATADSKGRSALEKQGSASADHITKADAKKNAAVPAPRPVLPQVRAILGGSKAAQTISLAISEMSKIAFGYSKFAERISLVDSGNSGGSIEEINGVMVVRLPFSAIDLNDPNQAAHFIRVAAHEFGHAVATFNTLNEADAELAMEYYLREVPENERGQYDIDEYLADLVAMRIIKRIAMDSIHEIDSGNADPVSSFLERIVFKVHRVLMSAANSIRRFGVSVVNAEYRQDEEMVGFADYLLKRRNARDNLEALSGQGIKHFTPREAITGMARSKAKAIDLAKGGLDSALVKLFKPTAMRLQKIDRALARMFFNPPGAKQEQGMGLMDMSVNTRAKLVNYFGRMYPKIDDFRKDYTAFLSSGKASTALEAVFRRAGEAYSDVNPEFQYTGVPLMLNMDEIARRGAEFTQLLNHEKSDDLLKSFDRNGGDASMNTDIKPANPFGRQELLDELIRNRPDVMKSLQSAGFFDPPTVSGINKFFGALAMRTEFERVFGGKQDVIPELGLSTRSPNMKLKSRLDAITDVQQRREAIAMIGSMLGFDGARVHPAWRKTQDWAVSVVSAAILPLSGFASLPDPMMPFIRTRSWSEAVKGLFSVVKSYATDYKRTAELTRTFSLVANSIHDTAWSTVVINKDGNTIPERISETLFRYNGLQFLTNVSRNVSAVLAIDMVRRHGSGLTAYSRQFLAEMGITASDAERLIAYIDEHGTVPQYTPGNEEVNRLHDIGQRVVTVFTNSSLIHPNKAQLPAIVNDPNFRVLTLLKPFLYGFHSTIYGGGIRAGRAAMGSPRTLGEFLVSSPAGVMPLMLAFGLMMPLAAAGLMAREHFRDFLFGSKKAEQLEAMDDMEYLSRIFSRSGGYGMLEYPMQIWEATQVDYRNPFIAAAGPVVSTFNDSASSMYGAFVEGSRDNVKFGLIEIPVE